jgi:hypothetical protein
MIGQLQDVGFVFLNVLVGRGDAQIGLEDLLFATEKETILLAIVVKFCQRISGAGFRTDKYLRSLATARSKTESSLHED